MKTLAGWNASKLDLTKYLRPGDRVDSALYYYCLEAVPPVQMTARLLQMGEPCSHRDGQPTFCTFYCAHRGASYDEDVWHYAGICFLGSTEHIEH